MLGNPQMSKIPESGAMLPSHIAEVEEGQETKNLLWRSLVRSRLDRL